MPTYTRLEYLTALVDRLYPEKYQRRGTASASGSTTTIVDTDAFSSSALFPSGLVGQWIWVNTSDTTGKLAQITVHDRSTGTITLDRAVTSTTTSTNWWITFQRNPQELFDAINQIIRNSYTPDLFPLNSSIMTGDDNDMEASGTSAWTATSGGAVTLAKVATASMPFATIRGGYALSVTAASGPADAAQFSASLDGLTADPDEQCFASILHTFPANATAMTSTFGIGDYSGASPPTLVDSISVSSGDRVKGWTELAFTFTGGTNYGHYTPLLYSDTAGGISYWKDLILTRVNQRQFPTPSWLRYGEQVIGVVEWPRGPSTGASDEYIINNYPWREVPWTVSMEDVRSDNEVVLNVNASADKRMYIYAMRPGTALATDAATGYLDLDFVTENAIWMLSHPEKAQQHLRGLRAKSLPAVKAAPPKAWAHFA